MEGKLFLAEIMFMSLAFTRMPHDSVGKESAPNAGGPGSIPGSGRSPGEGNGNPLQYSCPVNPKVREASWAIVHGIAKSWTQLSDFLFSLSPSPTHLSPIIRLSHQGCKLET